VELDGYLIELTLGVGTARLGFPGQSLQDDLALLVLGEDRRAVARPELL